MKFTPNKPAWMKPCRAELERMDARYALVFDARWQHFGEADCTARQLVVYLARSGYNWVPTVSTMNRWLNVIQPIEAKHNSQRKV